MHSENYHKKSSLHRFLNQRYLAVFIALIIIFVIAVFFLRHSAMDDTTDYYMQYEAAVLSEHYDVKEKIVEFDTGIKEYYWGINSLPSIYKYLLGIPHQNTPLVNKNLSVSPIALIPNELLNITNLYQTEQNMIYILPYFSEEKNEVFFVLHIFDHQYETLFYQSWLNIFIGVITLSLALIIIYSVQTNKKITQQVSDFDNWIGEVSKFDHTQLQKHSLPKSITFAELINSANGLQTSLLKQYELQRNEQALLDREKYFLTSLSHELRTPITIISAALTLLNKSNAIIPKDKEKLLKLSHAHFKMKQLTNTLLLLWREEQRYEQLPKDTKPNKVFLINELLELAVSNCQQQFLRKNIEFVIRINENTRFYGQHELADILINNLLRNACQYTADQVVKLELKENCLIIENQIEEVSDQPMLIGKNNADYGYGFGLFLADKICQQCHWLLNITTGNSLFKVEVTFSELKQTSV